MISAREIVMPKLVCAVALLLLLQGCVVGDANKTLEAATSAEQKIGSSGESALAGVAALTSTVSGTIASVSTAMTVLSAGTADSLAVVASGVAATMNGATGTFHAATCALDSIAGIASDFRPAAKEVTGILVELRATTADLRARVEDGWLDKRLLVALVVIVLLVGLHSVVSSRRTNSRITAMHADVKGLNRG